MTILKQSKFAREAEGVVLARSSASEGPVFAEPWEAQAFALAVKLSEHGHFTWQEWAATLADELEAANYAKNDDGSHYYHYWLAALEKLVTMKGLTDREAMQSCKDAWANAYRHTPHGESVQLET